MIKELLKNDITQMLDRVSSALSESDVENKDEMVESINEQLDSLELIDLFVTREYLKDQLEEATKEEVVMGDEPEAVVSADQDENKVYTTKDGKTYIETEEGL